MVEHWENVSSLRVKTSDLRTDLEDAKNTVNIMLKAYDKATSSDAALQSKLLELRSEVLDLTQQIGGSMARSEVGEKNEYPTIGDYLWRSSSSSSTYGPTKAQLKSFSNANILYNQMMTKLKI